MRASGVDRKDIFITQKVGPPPSVPLGYADTLVQMDQMLRDMQTDYVDLLLVHQRVQDIPQSADPYCNQGSPVYSEKECRLSTWRALLLLFQQGKALSVGVSNWNIADLQEIEDAGLPMPAVNQVPFNLYHSSAQQKMRDYCADKGILFHGYSGLGAPDVFTFPSNNTGMVRTSQHGTAQHADASGSSVCRFVANPFDCACARSACAAWCCCRLQSYIQLADPSVLAIAAAHNKTAAQVLIQWQYSEGMPINVRSQNAQHMIDNLNSYDFTLSGDEVRVLRSGVQAAAPWQAIRPAPTPSSMPPYSRAASQ